MKPFDRFTAGMALLLISVSAMPAGAAEQASGTFSKNQPKTDPNFAFQNMRAIASKQEAQMAMDQLTMEQGRRVGPSNERKTKLPGTTIEDVRLEADYILAAQYLDPSNPAHGAINNINFSGDPNGTPSWIVPRENALAILALLQAFEKTGNKEYKKRAELAADYLVRVQDADGGWFDQYSYADAVTESKSPTQTGEVMMALEKLGYSKARYQAMKKGAQFLMSLQDPANKGGLDDGLVGGGKINDTTYHTWRWASDNSFAYWAFKAAAEWAQRAGDKAFARKAEQSAKRVLDGINNYLYIDDKNDPDYGVWHRVIDANGVAQETGYHEWINYAPQMLDLPAKGVGKKIVGEWIHRVLQKEDGAVVWDDGYFSNRKSPGLTFQAMLVWQDLGQKEYVNAAWNWASSSGLWQKAPDPNGVSGSWIDWTEGATTANWWERFIDTAFYAVSVMSGGYDFRQK